MNACGELAAGGWGGRTLASEGGVGTREYAKTQEQGRLVRGGAWMDDIKHCWSARRRAGGERAIAFRARLLPDTLLLCHPVIYKLACRTRCLDERGFRHAEGLA